MVEYLRDLVYSLLDLPILLILGCGFCWLCVCLCFLVLVGSFFGGSFPPAGYLRVSLSPTSCLLLCRCGHILLELVLPYVQGFEAFLLLLFSCLFSQFIYILNRSWVDFVWFPLPPSPSSLLICWCFLCWWVSSSRRNPGVPRFYPLFFYGRPSPGYGCACRSFLDSHSPWFLWSQFPLRWGGDTPWSLGTLPSTWTHSLLLSSLPRVVPVASAPSEMRCVHSHVDGHPPGCWAPCLGWCL